VQPYAQRDAARSDEEVVPAPWRFFVGDVICTPEEVVAGDGQVLALLHHRAYQGAPSDGRSWGTGGRVVRYGHAAWQDADEELFGLLAAARQQNQSLAEGILLAFSLPGFAPPSRATKCIAQHTRTLRALREGSAREQRAALHALCSFVATGGDDADEIVMALHTKPT
jgi:hypothetical protein